MTKFTEGPWSAFCVGSTVSVDIGPKPIGSATCIVNWPGFDSCDLPLKEQKANAHLIAAAPEMYAALEALIEDFDNLGPYEGPDRENIEAGRLALAKARGEV